MDLIRKRVSAGLPDNCPTQQKKRGCFCKAIFLILFLKQPSLLLLNGEVIWQASDSAFSKELHERAKISFNYTG